MNFNKESLTMYVLKMINPSVSETDTIKNILKVIKSATNIDATGIRLIDNEDYPYYTVIGFSQEFVNSENSLCSRDRHNNIIRDKDGNPVLECMCGNVICGRTNPELPFFTINGSFYSNNTSVLLASTTEDDRQSSTRNRCNGDGYESVALIPLHSDSSIIGLLQLNGRKTGIFKRDDIGFFEKLGESIGAALTRKKYEEFIRNMNIELERKVTERTCDLQKVINEKEVLLKEIHHRIKNNLYTISSMLKLQSHHARYKSVKNALSDACSRVHSIGMVHQRLYQTEDIACIDIKSYLNGMIPEIFNIYHVDSSMLDYCLDFEDIAMNLDTAVPFGLIVNEIIVNSIKHAFPDGMPGMIMIRMTQSEDEYTACISDNGIGISEESPPMDKRTSLGFMIINNLVRQLDGKIEMRSRNVSNKISDYLKSDTESILRGVHYKITFNKEYKEDERWVKKEC